MQEIIQIKELTKEYKVGDQSVFALDKVSLSCLQGEMVAVLGPSGSGKSTLMNIVGGIDTADSGDIIVFGENITNYKAKELTLYRRKNIGYIFQFYNLIPNLNVRENVEVVKEIAEKPMDIDELLQKLNIFDLRFRYPEELSGGQQQRVAIARALVKNPKILLCDEPTGALDYESSIEALKTISHINKEFNTSVLIVTHNNSIGKICDRIVKLSSGKIVCDEKNQDVQGAESIKW